MVYDKESFLKGLALGLSVWMPPDERTINGNNQTGGRDSESEDGEEDENAV